jgi:glycosyl transferase, family 25
VKIQIISLITALERRQHIQNEFRKQNIEFEFFNALTANEASPLVKKMQLNFSKEGLSSGELACFMSHVSLWVKIINERIPYMAIFEDDVFLGDHAKYFLKNANWIQADCNILKLEAFSKKVVVSESKAYLPDDRALHILKEAHVGAAGYILSLKGAEYLLELLKSIKISEPLDHILFDLKYHSTEHVWQLMPALCIQGYLYNTDNPIFDSGLEMQRIERRSKESRQRSMGTKFKRELKRLYTKIGFSLLKQDMGFR